MKKTLAPAVCLLLLFGALGCSNWNRMTPKPLDNATIETEIRKNLAGDGINLSSDMLDRIDQIVPPGVTINVADNMWNIGTPALDAAFRRR